MGGEHVHLAAINEDMAVGVDTVGRRGRWASVREEREGERELELELFTVHRP